MVYPKPQYVWLFGLEGDYEVAAHILEPDYQGNKQLFFFFFLGDAEKHATLFNMKLHLKFFI